MTGGFTAEDFARAVERVVADRDDLRNLLIQVSDAVLDKAPDGMSVAYLPAQLLADIRDHLG